MYNILRYQANCCIHSRNLRSLSSLSSQYDNFSVFYEKTGNPAEVLQHKTTKISDDVQGKEVFVKMLLSPINPSDINIIEGMYPIKFSLPNTAGKEGVGKVMKIGSDVNDVSVGDVVIPDNTLWGGWTNYVKAPVTDFVKCPANIPLPSAATTMVNTCTAFRMLKDFEDMKPGDVVIQNGSNSGAGQAVIQIAAAMGLQTINIIRNRDNLQEMVDYLTDLGATHVITEEAARSPDIKNIISKMPKAKLVLNCVGGKSATQLLKFLKDDGTMVTYGGMSMSPVSIPTTVFIFKKIKLMGFWMSLWHQQYKTSPERQEMFDELFQMAISGKLKPPTFELTTLTDYKQAVKKAMEPGNVKQIIQMS